MRKHRYLGGTIAPPAQRKMTRAYDRDPAAVYDVALLKGEPTAPSAQCTIPAL